MSETEVTGGEEAVAETSAPEGVETAERPLVQPETAGVDALNDLLRIDHDAVQAYTRAIDRLESETLKSVILEFRADHERHISELTRLIRKEEGIPVEAAQLSTGPFEGAVQDLDGDAGDRAILLVFKAKEGDTVEAYRHATQKEYDDEIAQALGRNLIDEERHYEWFAKELEQIDTTRDGGPETTRQPQTKGRSDLRTELIEEVDRHPIRSVILAASVGFLIGKLLK